MKKINKDFGITIDTAHLYGSGCTFDEFKALIKGFE